MEPVWSIPLEQGRVEVPSSMGGVRSGLGPERAAEFDAAVARTSAKYLVYAVLDWALPPVAGDADEPTVRRLRAGDFAGVVDGDGRPVAPSHPPLDEAAGESAPTVYSAGFPVGSKTFPATIEGVRAVLEEGRRGEFEAEIARTPGHELVYALLRWATPPEDLLTEDALITELKAEEARLTARGEVEG
ncbi:hypothetical protein ACH41E_21965 [Streptomyces sp. NPDC020412]|uniref:hypothetical protein n=1 Tax=Streptomyces sp. NPDC020412 TaxID=3365073 RepID=UPI003790561C